MKDVGLQDFTEEVLNVAGPVLVDFWSPSCAPCRSLLPILKSINGEEAKVVKINVDDEPELTAHYKVVAVPTIIAFRFGKETGRLKGLKSRDRLVALANEEDQVEVLSLI